VAVIVVVIDIGAASLVDDEKTGALFCMLVTDSRVQSYNTSSRRSPCSKATVFLRWLVHRLTNVPNGNSVIKGTSFKKKK
jgi:hypothetical protein